MAVKGFSIPQRKIYDLDLLYKIVSWDQAEVEKYLTENGIHGCGFALEANSINGEAFLNLNNQTLASWEIPIIKRSKIIALLNELGSEGSRKSAIVTAHSRQKKAATYLEIVQRPTAAPPTPRPLCSEKPKILNKPNLPVIPPKPPHLLKKPIPTNSLSKDETQTIEKIPVQLSNDANNSPFSSESEYVGPESNEIYMSPTVHNESDYEDPENIELYTELDEESLTKSTIDGPAVSFETIHNSRTPSLVLSPDCQTDESSSGDDGNASLTNACFVGYKMPSPNKRPIRKKSTFTNWRNLPEEKLTKDPCGTPPLPPARNQIFNRCSSESNVSQSGSESRSSPALTPRKLSSQCATSQLNLAESLSSPSYPPPPVPAPNRRLTPASRPSPTPLQPNALFGSQIMLHPMRRSPSPSISQHNSYNNSPAGSTRSSNVSTDSEMASYPWFFNIDRKKAESILAPLGNGTFLIRPSKHGGTNASFTLSLQFNNHVFHVLIRTRPDGKMALGTEKKEENCFYTLHELVDFHYNEVMQLHSGNKVSGTTRLTSWPTNFT
ncbi:uncharacterized protein LOC130692342 isoform X2 [Daphnia carinata]|uniref:uncharacterized protein LOC130692342 isoform X2 n=1 Tax=Daphnia carinata TaxID=120202 RepID=UPI00286880C1|nr:uncharacterized protein LOC130692342 isoform X2 [Daphnia carinata]